MRRSIVLLALALAACGPRKPPPGHPTPPDLASNFNPPLDGHGGEPAWDLKIRGLQFTLSRPNQPDLVGQAPGGTIQAHMASWTTTLTDGRIMTVRLYGSDCSDKVSGLSYPFAAEVTVPGSTPLIGCAGPPAVATAAAPAKR